MKSTFEKMDRMYRIQRHFYDITRKYYLLGRDTALGTIVSTDHRRILEIGCGTGRNLIILAGKMSDAALFGIDASAAMIEKARAKSKSAGMRDIQFARALADDFHFQTTFGEPITFDAILLSYSLSMIPEWKAALQNALSNLAPAGTLFIVDFYDFAEIPKPLSRLLKRWLSLYGVRYRPEIETYLRSLEGRGFEVNFRSLYRRYCYLVQVRKYS